MAAGMQEWQTLLSDFSPVTIAPGEGSGASTGNRRSGSRDLLRGALGELPPLHHLFATAGPPLTLVVNDAHRSTDTRSFLDALFALADAEGLAPAPPGLRLLVAAGTHRAGPDERREHERRILGPHAVRFGQIVWHDADDQAALADVGGYGFHRWMAEGGVYLACGSMEPHYFAGVTGAHKTLTVGVMSRAFVEENHAGALAPEAAPLRLQGNPVHQGICDALAALESSGAQLHALDQIVIDGSTVAALAGSPLDVLNRGLDLVRHYFGRRLSAPVDVVVSRVGPPLDRDLYQADKGIKNTEAAVRDGGVLILDASCRQGIGIDHFVELLRAAPSHDEACRVVAARGYRLGDHKAVRLRYLTDARRVRVALVSPSLDPALEKTLGMRVLPTKSAAVRWLRGLPLPAGATAAIVDDAGNVAVEVG